MNSPLSWKVEQSPEHVTLHLRGAVTEDSDLAQLLRDVAWDKPVAFDLAEVTRINSCGVREWLHMMKAVPATGKLELVRCPPVLVNQLNAITNFSGPARVASVGLPFQCPSCNGTETLYASLSELDPPKLNGRLCSHCGGELDFDDLPAAYFAFMKYVRRV